jgi:hypothetical protein
MKQGVRALAAVPFLFSLLGLAAKTLVGCASGSDTSDPPGPGTTDAAPSGDDSASSSDSAPESSTGIDQVSGDAASGTPDSSSGADSATGVDASGTDAAVADSSTDSAAADSGSDTGAGDASPTVIFGSNCLFGTTYTENFLSDPVADGTFLPLVGSYTYDATNHTVSLAANSANTQLWIGPRPNWTSYTISASVRMDTANGNGGFTFRMESTPASPSNNAGQMYYAGIATNQVLVGLENGNWTEFQGPSATFSVGTYYTLAVNVNGNTLSVSVDGTAYVTNYSDSTYTFGSFGLRSYASGMTYGAVTITCH